MLKSQRGTLCKLKESLTIYQRLIVTDDDAHTHALMCAHTLTPTSNVAFYVQSTSPVILGQDTHTQTHKLAVTHTWTLSRARAHTLKQRKTKLRVTHTDTNCMTDTLTCNVIHTAVFRCSWVKSCASR